MKTTDSQRHAKKISIYSAAVERVGFSKLESKLGGVAMNKFELAKDAHKRQQSDTIVADFLADAQQASEKELDIGYDEITVYDALKSF
jgi:hypothetical protein